MLTETVSTICHLRCPKYVVRIFIVCHPFICTAGLWWIPSLRQEVFGPALSACPLSRRHCVIPLSCLVSAHVNSSKSPEVFKVLQSGSERDGEGGKKTGRGSKKTLYFGDWRCQKGFLLEDSKALVGGWRGAEGVFGGLGKDVNYGLREKEFS